jgi:glycosyl-4,4'-diaponeurosporenoate acyltransferase
MGEAVRVAAGIAVLVVWSLGLGWWAARLPTERLTGRRISPRELRWDERVVRIGRWKDRLPEWGTVFGGISKRHLPSGLARRDRLAVFAAESRRAEIVHWLAPLPTPLAFAVLDWRVATVAVLGAVGSNVPCLVVARYNRGRIEAMLSARSPR